MSIIPKRVTDTVDSAAEKLESVAADTKAAVIGAAVLSVAALVVAAVALVVAVAK